MRTALAVVAVIVLALASVLPAHAQCVISQSVVANGDGEVGRLVDEEYDPGYHRVVIDGQDLASGVYFCRMEAASFSEARKLVLLK